MKRQQEKKETWVLSLSQYASYTRKQIEHTFEAAEVVREELDLVMDESCGMMNFFLFLYTMMACKLACMIMNIIS